MSSDTPSFEPCPISLQCCSLVLSFLCGVRGEEGDMSLRRAQVLIAAYAAGDSGIPWKQIGIDLGIPATGVTRVVQSWDQQSSSDPYLEAVWDKAHPSGRSRKVVRITAAGRQAMERFLAESRAALEGHSSSDQNDIHNQGDIQDDQAETRPTLPAAC
jgi:DNA-binding MarR family transcriptional regulator